MLLSANLAVIDGGTVIQTDPLITRNGETGEGRIYRGPTDDGAFSAWAFTATSAFDNASGIDAFFSDPANLQVAAFKFPLLTLIGDPVIDTSNGGATKLALISIGNLTDDFGLGEAPAGAGGVFYRFTGLDTLLLATQAGSILLNSGTFLDIELLYFYARGATSDLILGTGIAGTTLGIFQAERDVQINGATSVTNFFSYAGRDFLVGSGPVSVAEMINIRAGNNVNFDLSQFGVGASSGQTVDLLAGNTVNIDATGDQSVFTTASSIMVRGNTIIFLGDLGTLEDALFLDATILFAAGPGGFFAQMVSFNHLSSSASFDITSEGEIDLLGIVGVDNMTAGTSFRSTNLVITLTLQAGTFIETGGSLIALGSITAGSTIDVAGTLQAPSVTAGGDVTADTVQVLTLQAPSGVLTAGSGGIIAFLTDEGATAQHTFTIDSIVSSTGIDFSGNRFNGTNGDFSGGRLTIFANSLRWDAEIGIGTTLFDGADFTLTGALGGNGGILTANATGSIFVGEFISATTGFNNPNDPNLFGGMGGQVTLNAGGMIDVNSTILVSSDEDPFDGSASPYRRSASGGNITLQSGITSGTAITLSDTSGLYSFLNQFAPGPGGTISITSDGGDIFANGEIIADRGTIIISNMGGGRPGGVSQSLISLGGSFFYLRSETLSIASSGAVELGQPGEFLNFQAVTVSISALGDIIGGSIFSGGGKGGPIGARDSDGNFNLTAQGAITLESLGLARFNLGRTSGLNLTVDAGTSLSLGTLDLSTSTDGLTAGGDIIVRSGAEAQIDIVNLRTDASANATSGGNILFEVGASLNAPFFRASTSVDNASLGSGANISLDVAGDATFDDGSSEGELDLEVALSNGASLGTGGNITGIFGGNLTATSIFAQVFGYESISDGGNISFDIGGNLTVGSSGAVFLIQAGTGAGLAFPNGGIGNGPSLTINAANITVGEADVGGNLFAYIDDSGVGAPSGQTANSVLIQSAGTITLPFGVLDVLGTVSAGGDINVYELRSTNVISVTSIHADFGGIRRFLAFSSFGAPSAPIDLLHTLTAPIVSSFGGIDFNGRNASSGKFGSGPATSGGALTINADSLTFGSGSGTIAGSVTLNGGDGLSSSGFAAADGGILTVNTTGDILVGSDLEATTGRNVQAAAPVGNGGTVALNSTAGTVTVNSRIEVSSADAPNPSPTPGPSRRRSNRGGNININSGKAGSAQNRAVAVNIGSSSQLLALLDAASTGPGGRITILATGANSDVNVAGRTEATRGTIDVRHQGDGGRVNIGVFTGGPGGAPTGNPITTMSADIIKAGAFGANGQLNVGTSTLSADTLIRLYATGSNGELNFVANTTLSAGTRIDLAANTITIQPSVVVNITGNGGAANVFTNVPNYNFNPGPGYSGPPGNPANGSFGGNGANDPAPLGSAPPFDSPPPPRPPSQGGL